VRSSVSPLCAWDVAAPFINRPDRRLLLRLPGCTAPGASRCLRAAIRACIPELDVRATAPLNARRKTNGASCFKPALDSYLPRACNTTPAHFEAVGIAWAFCASVLLITVATHTRAYAHLLCTTPPLAPTHTLLPHTPHTGTRAATHHHHTPRSRTRTPVHSVLRRAASGWACARRLASQPSQSQGICAAGGPQPNTTFICTCLCLNMEGG